MMLMLIEVKHNQLLLVLASCMKLVESMGGTPKKIQGYEHIKLFYALLKITAEK